MTDFISLECPSCGSQLQITKDIDRFICASCKNEFIVKRSGGIIALQPIVDGIRNVAARVDKTASELAIARLIKEIPILEFEIYKINQHKTGFGALGCAGGIILTLLGLVMISVSVVNPIDHNPPITPILLVGLGIILLIMAVIQSNEQGKKNKEEARPIQEVLEQKKRELSEHREIVSRSK